VSRKKEMNKSYIMLRQPVKLPLKNPIVFALCLVFYFGAGCHPFLLTPTTKANDFNSEVSPTFVKNRGGGNQRKKNDNFPNYAIRNVNTIEKSEMDSLSVTELKQLLSERGVDFRDCLEKRELVERLKNSKATTSSSRRGGKASSISHLSQGEQTLIETFKRVSPCVANIKTTKLVPQQRGLQLQGLEVPSGSGSGFLWDDKGHVVTNFHVVASGGTRSRSGEMILPSTVKVKLAGMADALDAKIIGVEPEKDLAVVKIEDRASLSNLPRPIDVGTSNDLQVGQSVIAIGNPFGLDDTLTTGIVSALGRDVDGIGGRPIHGCVQTDAAINPGNSGGPLLDSRGRLIGVNTAIFSPNGVGNVGIGFAIPVDTVRRVVNQLIQYGKVVRPTLGLSVVEDRLVRSIENQIGRPLEGCLVAELIPDGPSEDAGIEASVMSGYGSIVLGDLVTSIDGEKVLQAEDLISAVEERQEGDTVMLEIWRKCDPNKVKKVLVTLTTRDRMQQGVDRRVNRVREGMARPAGRRFVPW